MRPLKDWREKVVLQTGDGDDHPRPYWSDAGDGIPLCQEDCPWFDGKRCQALGLRAPLGHGCEPVIREMARLLDEEGSP